MEDVKLHRNVLRAKEAISAIGLSTEITILDDSARTVAEAAAALGVKEAQIAKSLVFLADGEPVMVVASGDERVDTKALELLLDGKKIGRADADAVNAATGYSIGGVSPAGLPSALAVYVQESLARFDVVWAAAGTPHAVFPTTFDEILRLTGGAPSSVGTPSE